MFDQEIECEDRVYMRVGSFDIMEMDGLGHSLTSVAFSFDTKL